MAYPAETWAKIDTDYKTGNYSVAELGKKWGISEKTIEAHIATSGVVKGELAETLAKQYEREFIKKGIDKPFIAAIVKDFLTATKTEITPSRSVDPATGEKEPGMAEIVPDRWAQEKGLVHYEKLVGAGADTEQKQGPSNIEIKVLILGDKMAAVNV